MKKINVLVFPCGSEIGLEIHRSLKYSLHIQLYGANSVNDHGRFVYEDYYGGLPFSTSPEFIQQLARLVSEWQIDAVYPTMDSVIYLLTQNQDLLGCKIISSPPETTAICLSKKRTYAALKYHVPVPQLFESAEAISSYPVFAKPEIGYGSRGANKIQHLQQAQMQLTEYPNSIFLEYLPGPEYTIDCFTDRNRNLLFTGCRQRSRIMNGISVNTATIAINETMEAMAKAINTMLKFRGAWFFQVKENAQGKYILLEVAARLAGSSAVYRCQGVNFAMLSIFDAFEVPVTIRANHFTVEMDRALDNRYHLSLSFNKVYVDFDDTVIVNGKINPALLMALFHFINRGKLLVLLTRHAADIGQSLEKYRIAGLFDQVIHLKEGQQKSDFIDPADSIFIDDSFAERKEVNEKLGIPVFAPDAVESLI